MPARQPRNPFHIAVYVPELTAQAAACWDPDLKHEAYVVTRQSAGNARSAVAAVSSYARDLGVRPGMPVQAVRQRYQGVKVLAEDPARVERARTEILAVCERFTPHVDTVLYRSVPVLDMSGTDHCIGLPPADREKALQQALMREVGFSRVQIGAARSPFISALCARSTACEDGIRRCDPGFESLVLADLKVRLLPGLGTETRRRLANMNLRMIGDVQTLTKDFLTHRLGSDGERLYFMVRGVYLDTKRKAAREAVRAEKVFAVNTNDRADLDRALQYVSDLFAWQLRCRRYKTDTVTLSVTYSDGKEAQHTGRLGRRSWDYADVYRAAREMLPGLLSRRISVRRLVQRSGRLLADDCQTDLFETARQGKERKIAGALDALRKKFGFGAIGMAEANDNGISEHPNNRTSEHSNGKTAEKALNPFAIR